MSITQKQNNPDQIQMLAAQRNLYSAAKRIIGFQMIISGPIAVGVTLLGLFKPEWKGHVALWGLTVLFVDLVFLIPWQKKFRENAARIQEYFDCLVLGLSWNEIKTGSRPDPELIHEQAAKYHKCGGTDERLKNWYPVSVDSVPAEWGTVLCQRANIFWDSNLRRRYANTVFVLLVAVIAVLVWAAFVVNTSLQMLVSFIAVPMASTCVLAYRQIVDHREAADRLDKLKDHADKLYAEAIGGAAVATIKLKSRRLQDEIFEGRKRNPPIFDFIFTLLRPQRELAMNKGAEALISEAKAAATRLKT